MDWRHLAFARSPTLFSSSATNRGPDGMNCEPPYAYASLYLSGIYFPSLNPLLMYDLRPDYDRSVHGLLSYRLNPVVDLRE